MEYNQGRMPSLPWSLDYKTEDRDGRKKYRKSQRKKISHNSEIYAVTKFKSLLKKIIVLL